VVSILETYQTGYLQLYKDYSTSTPVKVILAFLEESNSDAKQGAALADFSFAKSQKNLKSVEYSFSNVLVAKRRAEI